MSSGTADERKGRCGHCVGSSSGNSCDLAAEKTYQEGNMDQAQNTHRQGLFERNW